MRYWSVLNLNVSKTNNSMFQMYFGFSLKMEERPIAEEGYERVMVYDEKCLANLYVGFVQHHPPLGGSFVV